jgi:hypothetical protein
MFSGLKVVERNGTHIHYISSVVGGMEKLLFVLRVHVADLICDLPVFDAQEEESNVD